MAIDLEDEIRKIKLMIYVIIAVVFVCAVFNVPSFITNWIVQLLVSAIFGSFCSFVVGYIVEGFTREWLKKIAINIKIGGFTISVTAFAIVAFIVKVALFGF